MSRGGPASRELEALMRRRLAPGADRDAVDAEIRARFEERHAVVFTDLVGFSRRCESFGIIHFLAVIAEMERLCLPLVERFSGRRMKAEGDSWVLLFPAVSAAVDFAREANRVCADHNAALGPESWVEICAGVGWGEVLRIGDEDVWGLEVNYASRLGEDLARANEILLSERAYRALRDEGSELHFEVFELDEGSLPTRYFRLLG